MWICVLFRYHGSKGSSSRKHGSTGIDAPVGGRSSPAYLRWARNLRDLLEVLLLFIFYLKKIHEISMSMNINCGFNRMQKVSAYSESMFKKRDHLMSIALIFILLVKDLNKIRIQHSLNLSLEPYTSTIIFVNNFLLKFIFFLIFFILKVA